jgi:hypothetical protein
MPLIVAGCLIGVLAIRALYVEEFSLGWTDLIAAAILVPMGVLTARPLVKKRQNSVMPKSAKPKSAVFLCVVWTFLTIIIGTVLYYLLGVRYVLNPGPLEQPLLYIMGRSVVLRSIIMYLESVIIAFVLYAVILRKNLIWRRQQSKHPEEDEDQ